MALDKSKNAIGFIGLGIMGRSMAGHILAAGWPLHVYNRTRSKADGLVKKGARWHDSPGDVAAAADLIITIVGYPKDVEDVYLGPGGLVERARKGAILIDMTTSSPSLARRIAEAAAKRGLSTLDAPVSGGDVGARDAKLAIMVGGDAAAFETARPILSLMGTNVRLLGGPGAGQHTKAANQIVIASTIMGVCEGLSYARKVGLDPREVLAAIGSGAAGGFQLQVQGKRMLDGDFAPGFYVHHFLKDMDIALAEAEAAGIALPGLKTARKLHDDVVSKFGTDVGNQILYRAYD